MRSVILALIILLVTFNISYGQTKAEKIDALMNTYQEYGMFNGSVLIAEKGKVIINTNRSLFPWKL